jgi:hypothetical protein
MRRAIDILLIAILLAAVGYIVYQGETGDGVQAASATPSPVTLPGPVTETSAPTTVPTETLMPASVTIPTFTPSPTDTPAPTASPTASPTATQDPIDSITAREIRDGIDRGNQIIKAIEAYRADQGKYPAMLGDLVPLYIVAIPSTANDRPYFYRLFDASTPMASEVYWLAFRLDTQAHTTCTYYRKLDYWDCNTLSP